MKLKFILLIVVSLSILSFSSVQAGKRVNLDITSAGARKVPIAVPNFRDKKRPDISQDAARKMA